MSSYKISQAVGETTKVGIAVGSVLVFTRDDTGKVMEASGSSVPSAKAGYAVGCVFNKTGAHAGPYVNVGTTASCIFVKAASWLPATEYGFVEAKVMACATGVTAFVGVPRVPLVDSDLAFAEYATSDDSDQPVLVNVITDYVGATIVDPLSAHSLSVAVLRAGGPANFEVFAAGTFTTAGGDVAESITVAGVKASDVCLVQLQTKGAAPVTIDEAICAAGAITVEMSGDPSTDHVLAYVVLRAAGSFTPSHYVVAAGTYVCLTADAAGMAVAVTGALTTDIAFACISKTNDTDVLVTRKVTAAGTLTITSSADPDVAGTHEFDYFLLRAL